MGFRTDGPVISSPVVASGAVYVDSADHCLYALNAATGKKIWAYKSGAAVNGAAAVSGSTVYFLSNDGFLYAVRATGGSLSWKFQTQGESRFTAKGLDGMLPSLENMPDPWDFFLSSPVVGAGLVYFGSGDSHVYAVDASTGKLAWKFATKNVIHSSPALSNGVLYVGGWDAFLYALDAKTGKLIWKFETGHDDKLHNQTGIQGSPAVANGTVFFGCRDSNVYALDAKTGRLRWKQNNKGSWVIATPAVRDGTVYFTTSDSLQFIALDAATGKVLFILPTKAYGFSSPAVAGGLAFFGTFDGILHAVDLRAGKYISPFRTPEAQARERTLLTKDGHLNMDAIFGSEPTLEAMFAGVTRLLSLGSFVGSPVVADKAVIIGSANGRVYALH